MSLKANTEALQALLGAVRDLPEFALPKKTSITLAAALWTKRNGSYQQTITVEDGTASCVVALQPSIDQSVSLQNDGVTVLQVDNDNGTFIAKAVGAAPSANMTIQVTLMEVSE
jgi:hypothetical protein